MTINLPDDLASRLRAEVHMGRFNSLDDAVAEAVRQLLSRRRESTPNHESAPMVGFSETAELLDQMTDEIMQGRRTRVLRLTVHE